MSSKERFRSFNDWILPEFMVGLIVAGIMIALGIALFTLVKPLLSKET